MTGFEIAAIITAVVLGIPPTAAAWIALRASRKIDAVARDVTEVKDGVATINSQSLGQQVDKATLDTIEAIPEGARTPLQKEHVEAMKDAEK